MSINDHRLNKYDIFFCMYFDLLPLDFVHFFLGNNIFLAVGLRPVANRTTTFHGVSTMSGTHVWGMGNDNDKMRHPTDTSNTKIQTKTWRPEQFALSRNVFWHIASKTKLASLEKIFVGDIITLQMVFTSTCLHNSNFNPVATSRSLT